ncbi:MAG: CoA ester lyase [Chloroflexi bacterium]|nr:CoA ester lyase [Chloroflexota bacterium]
MQQPLRRSLLFVPGLRPDRYLKALETQADCVCVDLEDAVAQGRKDESRELSLPLFAVSSNHQAERVLRINGLRTVEGLRDLLAVVELGARPDALMLPKIKHAEEIRWLDELLTSRSIPLNLQVIIETADGLENAAEIAAASARVVALVFGAVDLSAELRSSQLWESLLYARSRVVHAAARAGIDAIDVPFLDLTDADALQTEARRSQQLGFTGKAAIHPAQLEVIHQVFSPTAEDVDKARRILARFAESTDGLVVVDGQLIEKPVVRAMQRVVSLAEKEASR